MGKGGSREEIATSGGGHTQTDGEPGIPPLLGGTQRAELLTGVHQARVQRGAPYARHQKVINA